MDPELRRTTESTCRQRRPLTGGDQSEGVRDAGELHECSALRMPHGCRRRLWDDLMRECPDCGLFSADTAGRCDCGFRFDGVDWGAQRRRILLRGRRFLWGGAALAGVGVLGGLSMLPFRFGLFIRVAGSKVDLGMIIVAAIVAARGLKLIGRARRLSGPG